MMGFARSVLPVAAFGAGFAVALLWYKPHATVEPPVVEVVPSPVNAVAATPTNTSSTSALQIDGHGLVSGHLDHVPLDWLFAELSRQGAVVPGAGPASDEQGDGFDGEADASSAATPATVDPAPALIATLRSGGEADRYDALRTALQDGIDVPQDVLAATFDAALSSRLDLLAFATYVDAAAIDERSARDALQRGASSNSAAVRQDAARRLAEFERMEHSSLASNQPTR